MIPPLQNRFATLPDAFYTRLQAEPLPHPYLVAFNPDTAALIGLPEGTETTENFLAWFSGNKSLPGGDSLASVYAGHQFGVYVPELGDGRALLLAETANGWGIQLKGSGRTPYSRFGDGRAGLRACIREYLCGEAMAGLGIPSTRTLCVIGSDEPIQRERVECAAVITRLAPSYIRFGSFEYFSHTGQHEALRQLADFSIRHYFPETQKEKEPYAAWFREMVIRTAHMIAEWQQAGFVHGVMNTDNMSILGLTLDYGPFRFMEQFNAGFVCASIDEAGRYAFDQQPAIGLWNLNAFAYALSPLIPQDALKEALKTYEPAFLSHFRKRMRAKLGLRNKLPEDITLIRDTLVLLQSTRTDYTDFFYALTDIQQLDMLFSDVQKPLLQNWKELYNQRLQHEKTDEAERNRILRKANPKYILRPSLLDNAISKAEDERDFREIETLRKMLSHPFDEA